MPLSSYPNGFANGLNVRGLPVTMSNPGNVYWVNNSNTLAQGALGGSDGNSGTYMAPMASLAGALAQCADGRGDLIMCMPNHAERISSATALTISKAGVTICGLGNGASRPSFTLDTANTATINIAANNVAFLNCRFIANFLAIAACFTLAAAKNFTLEKCDMSDTSAILNFAKAINTGTTDNACDGLYLEDNKIVSSHATNAYSIAGINGNLDGMVMKNNYIKSATTNAAALLAPLATGKLITNCDINTNMIVSVGATGTTTGLLFTTNGSTNSGVLRNNMVCNLATSPILITASSGLKFMNNSLNYTADRSGKVLPLIET